MRAAVDLTPGFFFVPCGFREPPVAAVFLSGPAPANECGFTAKLPADSTSTSLGANPVSPELPKPKAEEAQKSSNVVPFSKKPRPTV